MNFLRVRDQFTPSPSALTTTQTEVKRRTLLKYTAATVLLSTVGESKTSSASTVKREELVVSELDFDPEDNTAILQEALDSGRSIIVIENPGSPWITRPLFVQSNQTLLLEKGVKLVAKVGSFKRKSDCLLNVIDKKNSRILGHDAVISMNRADYLREGYEKSEWRHGLNLKGAEGIRIQGLTIENTGGDGIYIGSGNNGAPCKSISISHVNSLNNYRQGISITNVDSLHIENSRISGTSGTPPQAGIDFEPNHPSDRICNCKIEGCVISNNDGNGIAVQLNKLSKSSHPVDIEILACKITNNNKHPISVKTAPDINSCTQVSIQITNSILKTKTLSPIRIKNSPAAKTNIAFTDVQIAQQSHAISTPTFLFESSHDSQHSPGGLFLDRVDVSGPAVTNILAYPQSREDFPLKAIKGDINLAQPGNLIRKRIDIWEWVEKNVSSKQAHSLPEYALSDFVYEPISPASDTSANLPPFRIRGSLDGWLYASRKTTAKIEVRHQAVGNYPIRKISLLVHSPTGEQVLDTLIHPNSVTEINVQCETAGLYQITTTETSHTLSMIRSNVPVGLALGNRPLHIYKSLGGLYFYVPEDHEPFGIEVWGENSREKITAALQSPSGNMVWRKKGISNPTLYLSSKAERRHSGIWKITFSRPQSFRYEDFYLQIYGAAPLVTVTPKHSLKTSKKIPYRNQTTKRSFT